MGNAVEDHSAELIPPAPGEIGPRTALQVIPATPPKKYIMMAGEELPPHQVVPAEPTVYSVDFAKGDAMDAFFEATKEEVIDKTLGEMFGGNLPTYPINPSEPTPHERAQKIVDDACPKKVETDSGEFRMCPGISVADISRMPGMLDSALDKMVDEAMASLPPGATITRTYVDDDNKLRVEGIAPKDFYHVDPTDPAQAQKWVDEPWGQTMTPAPGPETAESMLERGKMTLHLLPPDKLSIEFLQREVMRLTEQLRQTNAALSQVHAEKEEFSDWAVYCECMMKNTQEEIKGLRAAARDLHDNLADAYAVMAKQAKLLGKVN